MKNYADIKIELRNPFKKFKFKSLIKWVSEQEKPQRWVVVAIAVAIEMLIIPFIFWLFDDRTVFDNDYVEYSSWGDVNKWGWVHQTVTAFAICALIAWFFCIVGEFAAYDEKNRTFRKLYKHD